MPRYTALDDSSHLGGYSQSNSQSHPLSFLFSFFSSLFKSIFNAQDSSSLIGYISGILFSVGWWVFIDGVSYASSQNIPFPVPIRFEDYVPGILSTFSLVIVNMIDKERLMAEDFSYSGTNVASTARMCAFIGVTMALGSIGGAVVILVFKYLVPGYSGDAIYFGLTLTLQNVLIFISSMTLWFGQNQQQQDASFVLY